MIQRIKSTAMALRQDLLAAGRIRKVEKRDTGIPLSKWAFSFRWPRFVIKKLIYLTR